MSTDLIETMRTELAPMTRSGAMGYGRRKFHGSAFDYAFDKLTRTADGQPADTTAAAVKLIAWLDQVRAFAEIIRDKEGPAEHLPKVSRDPRVGRLPASKSHIKP